MASHAFFLYSDNTLHFTTHFKHPMRHSLGLGLTVSHFTGYIHILPSSR